MTKKKLISIVTPVFNEQDNISRYFDCLNPILDSLAAQYQFELVFTDNRSSDKTYGLLKERARSDRRVRVFRFSRNFGYQRSIMTGYSLARGDAAIELDCDLQDPPELISRFLKEWESGAEIVYGVRKHRPEGVFITFLRKCFYRFLAAISEESIPLDAGDFMLIDRKVLDQLKSVADVNLYIRGIVFGMGYRQCPVVYSRNPRIAGISKFPLRKMVLLAVDGVVSQSILPLRIATFIGLLISVCTVLASVFYFYLKLSYGVGIKGFTTTVILILFSIGLNALFLGVIGEYVARIYRQTKARPMTIIDEYYENLF